MSQTDKKQDNVLYNIYVSYPPASDHKSINSKIRSAMANKDTAADVIRQLTDGKKPLVSEDQPAEKIQQLKEYFAYMGLEAEMVEIVAPVTEAENEIDSLETHDEIEWVAEESFDFGEESLPLVDDISQTENQLAGIEAQLISLDEIVLNTEAPFAESETDVPPSEESTNEVSQEEITPTYIDEPQEYVSDEVVSEDEDEAEYEDDEPQRGKGLKVAVIAVAAALIVGAGGYTLYNALMSETAAPVAEKKPQATPVQKIATTHQTPPKASAVSGSLNADVNSTDSLVYVVQNSKTPRNHNASSFYLFTLGLSPESRGLDTPLMDIPNPLKIRLLPDFIDTLLDFGQIKRADEALQYAAKNNSEFAQSQHFGLAKAHVLAYQAAKKELTSAEIQKHIDTLPESNKVRALLYAAAVFAEHGQSANQWLTQAQTALKAIDADNNSDKTHLQNLLHINQAAVLSLGNQAALKHGFLAQAKQLDDQLQKALQENTVPVEQFAIALFALRTASLNNDATGYQKAQKILMDSVNQLNGLKDHQTALHFWQSQMAYLPAELNHNLAQKMQPVVQEQLPIAEEAIGLYQVCRALGERDCYVGISERAFGNPRLSAKLVEDFGLQIYVYNILTASKQARQQQDWTQSEQWLRRAAKELL